MYNRESRIMRKLLGKPVTEASTGDSTIVSTATATPTNYRPIKSQNAVHPVAVPISCLDATSDGRAAVLGGPHILKTLVLDNGESPSFSFSEGIDIRASITSQKTSGSRANVVADQLNIRDVKWHENGTVFTACATGRIFAYDLARIGTGGSDPVDYIQMQEDSRQVNTLDVNPHLKSWLLSGSQDGIARIFDVSAPAATRSGILTFRQRFSPLKSNESIRKVMWSPRVGHEMACCTEGGVVLKWDVRQPQRPLLRINAHEKTCSTIAWHPDGIHLISAGWDSKLHVWDLGPTADKRQKPKWSITTPAPVSCLSWRPGLWSATAQSRRTAQVAVSYDESSNKRYGTSVVHVWDIARPTMPYKEIERFDTSPSAMYWRDQDMLWAVGQDGLFTQSDVAYAPKAIDRLSTSAMSFSPQGDVVMFLDERVKQSRPRPIMHHSETPSRTAYGSSPGAQLLSGSKSDSEEDVVGTFIGQTRKLAHRRRLSGRSGQLLSTTPPPSASNYVDPDKKVLSLDQSIGITGMFKSQQVMTSGKLPASTKVTVYQYLTASYLETLERILLNRDEKFTLAHRVGVALEQFSQASENVRLYRLSQSWRVVAFAMDLLLKKRANFHMKARLSRFQKIQVEAAKSTGNLRPPEIYGASYNGEETPRRPSVQAGSIDSKLHAVRSLLSEEIESTSNVPTPIARPADTPDDHNWENGHYQHGKKLTPIIEPESFDLGPAMHTYKQDLYSQGSLPSVSDASRESELSEASMTEGYDFYDTEALARAIDVPVPKTKEAANQRIPRVKPVRHHSEDSMGEMFSISDGTKKLSLQGPSVEMVTTSNHATNQSPNLDSGRSSTDTQYEPRIHGDTQRRKSTVQDSPEDVFMISQTTASTEEAYTSQPSFTSQSDSDQNPSFEQLAVPLDTESYRAESVSKPTANYYNDPRQHVVDSDYFPWPDDPDFLSMEGDWTVPAALDPYLLLKRAFDFECRASAVNAAAMVLLLRPLLTDDIIDTHLARARCQNWSVLLRMPQTARS
ncbi:hypothetical protein NQ176_g10192 [Zarea fungicola]|uniref:Uncharacterized protein n=1 Tax=Zarea fungicola TaxID=93591 RepID=A0ACC1MH55_9HYPO|nr:hypothetical protein NQ176_g10192 [Lecanicillium fungicola]